MTAPTPPVEPGLLEAVMAVASELDLSEVLDLIVRHACRLTGAAYAALGVLSAPGSHSPVRLEQFHHVGLPPELEGRLGPLPQGHGVLGVLIDDPRPLRLERLSDHPDSVGVPATHPPMSTFLGVPVRVRGTVFGNLYLCEKAGGRSFTDADEQLIVGLAAAAGIAVANARLFAETRARQRWADAAARVSAEIGRTPATAPGLVAEIARDAGGCTAVAVALPVPTEDLGDPTDRATLAVNGAAGARADDLLGQPLTAYSNGPPTVAELFDAAPDECIRVEVAVSDETHGALFLHRAGHRWTSAEMEAARAFGSHVSLALDHARREHDRHRLAVFSDRDRIARDLHDRVIQRLFAVGLGLHSLRRSVGDEQARHRLHGYLEDIDATITEIRTSIFFLHHDPSAGPQHLRSDVLTVVQESARILGFSPQVVFLGPVDQPLPLRLRTDLLATLRESLSNVIRHARASAVEVRVHWDVDGRRVTLQVDDDGRGLDPAAPRGSGLRNTAARAHTAGGSSWVGPRPGGGTSFRWAVHVPAPASADRPS